MKSVIQRDREPLPCPSTCAGWWVIYKVYHAPEDDHGDQFLADRRSSSVVSLEWASPGVGGGVVFPLSVSVGLALKLLFSDILIGVSLSDGGGFGGGNGDEGQKGSVFHFTFFKICN